MCGELAGRRDGGSHFPSATAGGAGAAGLSPAGAGGAGPVDTPSRRVLAACREEASEPRIVLRGAGVPSGRAPRDAAGPRSVHQAPRVQRAGCEPAVRVAPRGNGSLRCVGREPGASGSLSAGAPLPLSGRSLDPRSPPSAPLLTARSGFFPEGSVHFLFFPPVLGGKAPPLRLPHVLLPSLLRGSLQPLPDPPLSSLSNLLFPFYY